jgi:hypothetical protein
VPWLKLSDRFALHPLLLKLRRTPKADERTTNEVTGFVSRCASLSAGYMTDYYVDLETAEQMGLARTQVLLRQATAAGLLIPEGRGNNRRWRIVEEEDLFHIRAREDVEWERQRDRDRRNPELTMPVLARDGDQCRYCLHVVNWKDTRSGRGGTFDHREPGQAARVETYVVSCRTCNSKRKASPDAERELPLQPPPLAAYFSPKSTTKERLEEYFGRPFTSASQPRPVVDTAAGAHRPGGDAAQQGAHHQGGDAAARPTTDTASREPQPEAAATGAPTAHAPPDRTTAVPPWSEGGRPVGTGRDGNGLGQEGSAVAVAQPARPRGARGRRGGGSS